MKLVSPRSNTTDKTLYKTVCELLEEADIERKKFEPAWDTNRKLLLNAHKEVFAPGTQRFYAAVNRTANSIRIKHAILTEQLVRPVIVGREANETPDRILREEAAMRLPAELIELAARKLTDPEYASLLKLPSDDGMTPRFSKDDFWEITDTMVSEAVSQEIQSEWSIGGCDELLAKNNHDKLVYGHKDLSIQWDSARNIGIMRSLYPFDVWIDPQATNFFDADYAIVRRMVSPARARLMYPAIADKITDNMISSLDGRSGSANGARYLNLNANASVPLHSVWIRNHTFALDPDAALQRGDVQQVVDEAGNQVFVDAEGNVVAPNSPAWPKVEGIRQIEMVGDIVVFDGMCEFSDIPLARNYNLLVPESPYGIGDPEDLKMLQDLYNRLFSIYHEHLKFYAYPTKIMPAEVMEELQSLLSKAHTLPGLNIPVRTQLWMQFGGNVVRELTIPQLNQAAVQILSAVRDEIDTISGISMVLRGNAMSAWSGSLYNQATDNAKGPIGSVARQTVFCLQHLTRVWVNLIVSYLPAEVWAERNRKYPVAVYQVIKERAGRLDYDVDIQISAAKKSDSDFTRLGNMAQTNPLLMQSPTFAKNLMELSEIRDGERIADELQSLQQTQQQAPTMQ